jgi:adenylylsulfate kinase
MIINLTGQPGAGKTTIAKELIKMIPNSINVDGDELRDILNNKDYSVDGRRNNIKNAYNIALFLEKKGFVPVISLISPFNDLREDLKLKTKVLELYIYTTETRGREHLFVENYEIPNNAYYIDTTLKKSTCESSEELIKYIIEHIKQMYNLKK